MADHYWRSFRGAALNNRTPKRRHLGDTLCPDAGIANASSGLAEDADPGTAHKAFDTPEGFYRYHYKLVVYTAYRNYCLPYLRWSLENKMWSLDFEASERLRPLGESQVGDGDFWG
ncbi:hypothetical protein D9M71_645280 [compost metagenome]